MLEAINTEANSNLDVQIRNNFLNAYYNGANIAKVSGENNVDFDQFYFSLDKDRARNVILEDQAYIDDLKSKKAQLIKKFNNGKFWINALRSKIRLSITHSSVTIRLITTVSILITIC